jgi:hypothetical protein
MAQGQEDKVPEKAEAWDKVAAGVRAGVLQQAPAATASAPSVGKKRPINRARRATSSHALSAGLR